MVYQDVAVTAGQSYATQVWIFSQDLAGVGAVAELFWLDSQGLPEVPPPANLLGTEVIGGSSGNQGWTQVGGSFIAPVGAVVARVQFRVALEADDGGAAWFDDLGLAAVLPDVTPPQVAITAPAAGAAISGTLTITADATDDGQVADVQFQVDSHNIGPAVLTPPYELVLDSYTLSNGIHLLTAIARDTAGNSATSAEVSIQVNNPLPQNVVLIVSDDQRFDLMQYMPLTSALLNAETVRFTRGFATTSTCCPSRSSILTGLYSHNTHVLNNSLPNGGATRFDPTSTIATWLHQAGYRTGIFGKYLNDYDLLNPAIPPGWDEFQVFNAEGAAGQGYYLGYSLNVNGTTVQYGTAPEDYSTDVLAKKVADFILTTPPRQPFFAMYTPFGPHQVALPSAIDIGTFAGFPLWRPPSYNEADVNDKPAWVRNLPTISAAKMGPSDALHQRQVETLQSVDRAVNLIVATLKQANRWESTLLVYISDNGLAWGEHRLLDRKECAYEECAKVPIWVRAPGLVARADTHLVANIDLAPTFAAWAGITPPGKVNGLNLLPLLNDPGAAWRTELLLEHLGDMSSAVRHSAIRTAKNLYVEYQNGNKELYNLVKDPYELTNVASKTANASLISSLKAKLKVLKAQ
ncbi:MAG TPA: sulfatase-like hydrolase/transferase [Gemmatimonadales bacterium]|nr:sulfatase-like hydrolase/transferase [Gemmatimonadales bacterium]